MLQRLKVTSYALIILLILVLPSQADEYCTTADMCRAAAQAAGKMLGNQGKNGISGYPFVLGTNTYGCWYYPDSHANKNYAGSAFWGAASSEAQMRDPDPGAAHHVRLKCDGGAPPDAYVEAPVSPCTMNCTSNEIPPHIKQFCKGHYTVLRSVSNDFEARQNLGKNTVACRPCLYRTGRKNWASNKECF